MSKKGSSTLDLADAEHRHQAGFESSKQLPPSTFPATPPTGPPADAEPEVPDATRAFVAAKIDELRDELRRELAARAAPPAAEDVLLPTTQVARRYRVSRKTIERWQDQPALDFPAPLLIHRKKYWRVRLLEAWERGRAAA